MKILSAQQIRELDKYTIENEPISSVDLMERAANKFTEAILTLIDKERPVLVFCGMGNNGGDGLAIARLLFQDGYQNLKVFIVKHAENGSADFKTNEERLNAILSCNYIEQENQIPAIEKDSVCIDAIFGSGLSRAADGISAAVINAINASQSTVYGVDIPSGLFCDKVNDKSDVIVQSSITFTFHAPKLSLLFPNNAAFVQEFRVLDIGLSHSYAETLESPYIYVDAAYIDALIKRRSKFSHKGTYGHALICAGSYGKMGAAVLSVSAALRSGTGLVSAHIPRCGTIIMQTSNPGAMVIADEHEFWLTSAFNYKEFTAIGIGPGIGVAQKTVEFLEAFMRKADTPLIIDADALNIISSYGYMRELLPHGSILTPHPGEFKKLVGDWPDDMEKHNRQLALSKRYKVTIVLKGANTSISTPEGKIYFNSTGNPGMAKGGSGDVLTGVISALRAQKYSIDDAAAIGVYIHGAAGDLAASDVGIMGMNAEDIIAHLPQAFARFEKQ